MDDVALYMEGRGLANGYDHLIIAGASIGALTENIPPGIRPFGRIFSSRANFIRSSG